jgi:hypothetical protein
MAACAAASTPVAAGALLAVESFNALPEADAESADAFVPCFAVLSSGGTVMALPGRNAGVLTAVDVPGAASVRMLGACGMFMPEPIAVGAAAADAVEEDGAVASSPVAEFGNAPAPGRTAGP